MIDPDAQRLAGIRLRAALQPDTRVYLVERSPSRSKYTRYVDLQVVAPDRTIASIAPDVAAYFDLRYAPDHKGLHFTRTSPEQLVGSLSVAFRVALVPAWL